MRDGAAIVEANYQFFRKAYPDRDPPLEHIAHFSMTCDLHTAVVYVHWRHVIDNQVLYEMETIEEGFLSRDRKIWPVRRAIKNIIEHAKGERLRTFKAALPSLKARN
jgi:hypothetical protein